MFLRLNLLRCVLSYTQYTIKKAFTTTFYQRSAVYNGHSSGHTHAHTHTYNIIYIVQIICVICDSMIIQPLQKSCLYRQTTLLHLLPLLYIYIYFFFILYIYNVKIAMIYISIYIQQVSWTIDVTLHKFACVIIYYVTRLLLINKSDFA